VGPISNLNSNERSSKFIAIKICGELVSMYRIATFPNRLSMRGGFSGEELLEELSISKCGALLVDVKAILFGLPPCSFLRSFLGLVSETN